MNHDNCPHCGQAIRVYARSLRIANIKTLKVIADKGEITMTQATLDLGFNTADSTPILRNFGLIERGKEQYSWKITHLGQKFLSGLTFLPKYYFVFNNQLQPTPLEYAERQRQVYIWDIDPEMIDKEKALEMSSVNTDVFPVTKTGQMAFI